MKRKLKITLFIILTLIVIIPLTGYVYLFLMPVKPFKKLTYDEWRSKNISNISEEKINNKITLSDGRYLGYAEYGDSLGLPIFYFHGGQESRLSSIFMHDMATQLGVRIISPDRPGIGLSSYQKGRTFLDWPKDIVELADSLKITKFSIFGLSGGAPHVLACTYKIPERIIAASIVSGAAPYNYEGSLKGMWPPVKFFHWLASRKNSNGLQKVIQKDFEDMVKAPKKRIEQFQNYLPEPDRKIMLEKPEYGWEFINGSIESYAQGIDGVVQEWKLYVSDWGFSIDKIEKPVCLWFGTEDKMAPKYRAFYYDEKLPNSTLHLIKNEGHFSLIRNHLEEVLIEMKTIHNKS
jgi:pimeloyl-ACP methyl ester carboxylesterase